MELNAERSYGLDCLKVLATIIIVFLHYQQEYEVPFDNHINFLYCNFSWGYIVELFFVISGYLTYKSIPKVLGGEITLDKWFGHKLRRFVPVLTVSVLVYEFGYVMYPKVFGEYFMFQRDVSLWRVLITSLGIHAGGAFANTTINNPVWYISVLLYCYIIFFALTCLSKKIGCKPYYLYIVMIFVGFSGTEYCFNYPFLTDMSSRGYYSFFFGLVLAHYVKTFGIRKGEIVLSLSTIALFLAILAVIPWFALDDLRYTLTFVVYPAIIMLVESSGGKKLFCSPFWGKWGAVSFNVFIWHLPMFILSDLACYALGLNLNHGNPLVMYLYLFVIEIFAVFSHLFIEKPLDKLVGIWANSLGKNIV